ncbi:extracellular solute-binding protein [Mycoplasmatota bacterium]|nr:extracellular solute-binding protein [Mycoplasmatota bacterium]
MKKLLRFHILILSLVTISGCSRGYDECKELDGSIACWNASDEVFRWEEGAIIEVGVDKESMGRALIEKWNSDFPELSGKLVFKMYGVISGGDSGVKGIETDKDDAPDIALVVDNEVVGNEESFLVLHDYFSDLIKDNSITEVTDIINTGSTVYITAYYEGMIFSWNETMLEELGLDTTDKDSDNLPDAYDTWEEILDIDIDSLPKYKDNKISELFPISLSEVWSGYPALTSDGWELFGDDSSNPGFDSIEFLNGLRFINTFSKQGINIDEIGNKKTASSMRWRFDEYLTKEAYPFSLVGTWMDVSKNETANNTNFRFGPMPTWNGKQLTPLMKTYGFVINGSSKYPSASSEVLRWLYTPDTIEAMLDNSFYIPAIQKDGYIYPDSLDQNRSEIGLAFLDSQMELVDTLPNNDSVRAMSVYYSIGITDALKAIWDGTMTPEEAQEHIVLLANAWMEENNK